MISDEDFTKITENCQSMAHAAKMIGMSYSNFKKRAEKLGCFKPNQGLKGSKKPCSPDRKFLIEDILAGKYPQYQTYKLKRRLITGGYLEDKCSLCGWDKKPEGAEDTPCELDLIDGNPTNHRLENLRIICPNCHSLTNTYRFRRGKTNESQGRKLLDENEANSVNL